LSTPTQLQSPEYRNLHWSGWAEAASFLALLGFAMPMKYLAGQPIYVKIFGQIHGGLFILYVVFALLAARAWQWPNSRVGLAILAAILPFGPLWFDRKVRAWLSPAGKHQS